MAVGRLDCYRTADGYGCPQLRRVSRDDAQGGRPVRLSARSLFALVGVSLRLDAISRNSNRHRGCRRRRVCALSWCAGSSRGRRTILDFAQACNRQLRDFPFHRSTRGHSADRFAHFHEHAGIEARQAGSECLYNRQARRAARTDRAWSADWLARRCGARKLR